MWYPEIEFQNIVKNELENKEVEIYFYYEIYNDGSEDFYIEIKEKGIGTFTKPKQLDFRAFPFDSHNLEFIFSDVKDGVYTTSFNLDYYSDLILNEKLKAKIVQWNIPGELGKISSYDHYDLYDYRYDGLNYSFDIERNSVYYIWKILAPIFLLLILSWSVFWLKIEHIESRLTVTIVSLLALIAYNNIVDENIPQLPYLTIMDQIILSSYVFATIPTFLSILYSNYNSKINSSIINSQNYVRIIGPILYLLILFAILFSNINENPSAVATMKNYFG